MRHFIAAVAPVVVVATAACSIPTISFKPDAAAPPDAPPGRFACYNAALPPVPETVTISGTVMDALSGHIQGTSVSVEVLQTPAIEFVPPMPANVGTNGAATFSVTHTTGMAQRDIYFHVHANGYLDTYYYPALPLVGDLDVTILLFTTQGMGQLANVLNQMGVNFTPDPSKATLIVAVVDCNDDAVGAATVATSSDGTMVYLDTGVTPNVMAHQTDPTTGSALIVNASPVTVMVDATVSGMPLRGHSINGYAGAVTQAEIQP